MRGRLGAVVALLLVTSCSPGPEELLAAAVCDRVESYLSEQDFFEMVDDVEQLLLEAQIDGVDGVRAQKLAEEKCGEQLAQAERDAEDISSTMEDAMEAACANYDGPPIPGCDP